MFLPVLGLHYYTRNLCIPLEGMLVVAVEVIVFGLGELSANRRIDVAQKKTKADSIFKDSSEVTRSRIIFENIARSNSKVKSTNCHARNMSVIRQQTNLKGWKRSVSCGYRWITETVFSSIKRTFGEYVAARKFPHMVKEIFLKAALYNMFNRMI
jgi:hypothetical protein